MNVRALLLQELHEFPQGSWELWWTVSQEQPKTDADLLKKEMAGSLVELVHVDKLVVSYRRESGYIVWEPLTESRLLWEIENVSAQEFSDYYWFSLTKHLPEFVVGKANPKTRRPTQGQVPFD